jgi:hypothetical protein
VMRLRRVNQNVIKRSVVEQTQICGLFTHEDLSMADRDQNSEGAA